MRTVLLIHMSKELGDHAVVHKIQTFLLNQHSERPYRIIVDSTLRQALVPPSTSGSHR